MTHRKFILFLLFLSLGGLLGGSEAAAQRTVTKGEQGAVVYGEAGGASPQSPERGSAAPTETTIKDAEEGKISLDLKGVDIVELLKILSLKMDTNIVPSREVTGRVNVFLNNVTLEDALDIILINNSLAAVKENNIITVMPLEKYTQLYGKRYKETRKVRTLALKHAAPKDIFNALSQLKTDVGKIIVDESTGTVILVDIPEALDLMEKTTRTLDKPKDTEIFNLKYAKAEDIKAQLQNVFTPGSSDVEFDTRTNKIAVSDLPERMKKIRKMIQAFDDETKQVLIEAQIVQISLNDRTQFGIDWERLFTVGQLRKTSVKGLFPAAALGNYGKLSVGTLDSNDFNVVIQALNTLAKTNILSRPRIAVVNNQEASILIGSKEAYFSQTQSQSSVTTTTAESVNYVDVGVKLNVTPTISDDGYVVMKIRPEVSSVRETVTSPLGSRVPVVETSQAETVVKVRDKAMVMIAGLMKEEVRSSKNQIPIIGKLPILSWIFGNRDEEKKKTELAIFLTPYIISGDVPRLDAEKEQIKAHGVLTKKPKGKLE